MKTYKPTTKILAAVKKGGRVIEINDSGLYWNVYQRGATVEKAPETTYDMVGPDKSNWVVTIYRKTAKPWIWCAD